MPRLKTLLACAGLSSLNRCKVRAPLKADPEPIKRPFDDNTQAQADDWLFDHQPEATAHGRSLDMLTGSLQRLREALSGVAVHAPVTVEAEPVMPLGAFNFDGDLFDGEPLLAGMEAATAEDIDSDLFEDTPAPAIVFARDEAAVPVFRQAA